MSRLNKAFENKKALAVFVAGGDPDFENSREIILQAARAGADLIEIGIPFSDPVAEGEAIQNADIRALKSGADVEKVLSLAEYAVKAAGVPIVLTSYLNLVFKYGYERFFSRCEDIGVDGVIIPDLPFEEKNEVEPTAKKHGVALISVVTPASGERISMIAGAAKGFIYICAPESAEGKITAEIRETIENIRKATDIPAAVCIGESNAGQAAAAAGVCDGIIVDSAVVKLIEKHGADAAPYVFEYVSNMKKSIL